MDENKKKGATPAAPEEEIIEKKPFHPVETSLVILTFLALCFAIYLICDELGLYSSKEEYETGVTASTFYGDFKTKNPLNKAAVNEKTDALRAPGQ